MYHISFFVEVSETKWVYLANSLMNHIDGHLTQIVFNLEETNEPDSEQICSEINTEMKNTKKVPLLTQGTDVVDFIKLMILKSFRPHLTRALMPDQTAFSNQF